MSLDISEFNDLKKKVDDLGPPREDKLSMIVFSGDLDKVLAAMIIAVGAAVMDMKVVLFFTFWGTAALRKPQAQVGGKNLMSRMFGWMLPTGYNKLKLSKMNMGGMGTAMMKGLMKKKGAPDLEQLFAQAAELGVKIYVCEMSMDLMGFRRDEIIEYPGVEYVGVASFLAHAANSSNQLFI
ncbi:MAG: DsrE/DsrF/DrsH-like family protein [Desulfomonilaceae bacterium]